MVWKGGLEWTEGEEGEGGASVVVVVEGGIRPADTFFTTQLKVMCRPPELWLSNGKNTTRLARSLCRVAFLPAATRERWHDAASSTANAEKQFVSW